MPKSADQNLHRAVCDSRGTSSSTSLTTSAACDPRGAAMLDDDVGHVRPTGAAIFDVINRVRPMGAAILHDTG